MTVGMKHHQTVDAKGEFCPMPILRAKRALRAMNPGELLLVLCTDPVAPRDFARFTARNGCALVSVRELDGQFEILVRKQNGEGEHRES